MIEKVFTDAGDFEAVHTAEAWCVDNGISVGMMCGPEPRGLLYGDFLIAKWKNLTAKERRTCDGYMTGNMRNGPITVKIKEKEEWAAPPQ